MKNNNAWNIRRLVDESFVPSTHRIILKIVGFPIMIYGVNTYPLPMTLQIFRLSFGPDHDIMRVAECLMHSGSVHSSSRPCYLCDALSKPWKW